MNSNKTILIVEDDFKLLRLYSRILKNAGHTVHQAATVQAASEMLGKYRYDVCISDMTVGHHRGADVLSLYAEAQADGMDLKVVSGSDTYADVVESIGAVFFLKPVSSHDLIDMVSDHDHILQ